MDRHQAAIFRQRIRHSRPDTRRSAEGVLHIRNVKIAARAYHAAQ